jgi:SWI/SNF-related matrix-associated actin-dependent regulator of chromatin subfamily A3
MIQNPQSQLAQACCALRAERRWGVTGTPIQNKLTDFASILRFLCVCPYSEHDAFHEDISRPWHRGDPQGFLRLKTLVKALTISRTKSVVRLPSRIDEIHHLEFAPLEREIFNAAKREAVTLLDDAISSGSQAGKSFNALQRLNTLRLICCQGLLTRSTQAATNNGPIQNFAEVWSRSESSVSASGELIASSVSCSFCGVDLLEDFLEGSPSTGLDNVQQTDGCGSMLCEQCNFQLKSSGFGQGSSQLAEDISNAPSPARSTIKYLDFAAIGSMSTKFNALLIDILNHS